MLGIKPFFYGMSIVKIYDNDNIGVDGFSYGYETSGGVIVVRRPQRP